MKPMRDRLALHTWTLDTTPLADVLRFAKQAGWNAVELRRVDFTRSFEAGMTNEQVLALVRASGLKVGIIGTEYGVLFAKGAELKRLFDVFAQTCANAVALDCAMIMVAPGPNTGSVAEAAVNLRAAGEIAQAHGVRLALEFSAGHDVINHLTVARDIITRANHPHCGLLLDAYHLERTGSGGRGYADVAPEEIFTFQYSDVPPTPLTGDRRPVDRLAPGKGVIRWNDVFGLLLEKGYTGYLSYEAPNPAQWSRPPLEVAREGVDCTRALLAEMEARSR
jgi:sugar phosphate isomerase/epimerase